MNEFIAAHVNDDLVDCSKSRLQRLQVKDVRPRKLYLRTRRYQSPREMITANEQVALPAVVKELFQCSKSGVDDQNSEFSFCS